MRETGIASNEMKHLHPKATEIFVSHTVEKENENALCTNEETKDDLESECELLHGETGGC